VSTGTETTPESEVGAAAPGAAGEIRVRTATADDDAQRDRFVEAHPRGTFFHLAGWVRAVERHFGHDPMDLVAERDGRIAGVLPLMRCRTPWGGRHLISTPYAVYGGALGADRAIEQRLVRSAQDLADSQAVGRLELRYLADPGLDLPGSDLYATFIGELPGEPAQVLAGMPKKSRAEARKARERHGLELTEGRWYLEDLVRLFQHNKRQLGSPGLPVAWFRGLLEQFGSNALVHLVHRGREPLAAVMSFRYQDTLLAYYAGTAPGADRSWSASNFMYMALREWAVEQGFERFDFGRSRRDSGACAFKERQGFEAIPLCYRYHLVRKQTLPSFNPSNPSTKILRDSWSKLPPWLALKLSERLARYLP
jgi:FemAB-related protein (PEP-CTERM system-associated)